MQRKLEEFVGLAVGQASVRTLTRLHPAADRLFGKPSLCEMMGDNLRQGFGRRRKPLDQHFGDA
ncbi:hypothetical protein GALL_488650 [mine drainage metagenome]|uniref:Uncharacterized protein n=1 Tax=mine drainage metagenome TaxID=410659 RepID=A0A1J5PPM4_9ZZZZ